MARSGSAPSAQRDVNALMHTFMNACRACRRRHRMSMQKCPECGVYEIPMPHSEAVYEACRSTEYRCDGCDAYRDRFR